MLQCALELLSTTQVHKLPSSSRDAMQANLSNRRSLKTFRRPYFWLSREGAKRSAGAMEGDSFLVEFGFLRVMLMGRPPLPSKQPFVFGIRGKELMIRFS